MEERKSKGLPPWYNWNIVASGVKHHNSNPKGLNRIDKILFYETRKQNYFINKTDSQGKKRCWSP